MACVWNKKKDYDAPEKSSEIKLIMRFKYVDFFQSFWWTSSQSRREETRKQELVANDPTVLSSFEEKKYRNGMSPRNRFIINDSNINFHEKRTDGKKVSV